MQRITITIDDALLAAIDQLRTRRGYGSRSEAVRDIVRDAIAPTQVENAGSAPCYGALCYVYAHTTRDLARRLTDQAHHHDVSVANLHVHLNRTDCLEVAVLRGPVGMMQAYADSITTQRGVRYGRLQLIPEAADGRDDSENDGHHP